MVVFDLMCPQGHRFEGWFDNLQDLETQMEGRLISCPVCGEPDVQRLPSTFGMVKKYSLPEPSVGAKQAPPTQDNKPKPVETAELVKNLQKLSERIEKEFDDVGTQFADEALKIHYGASERRNIRGHSSDEQDKMLREEGVNFFKLPIINRKNYSES